MSKPKVRTDSPESTRRRPCTCAPAWPSSRGTAKRPGRSTSHIPSTRRHTVPSSRRPTETELTECRPRYLLPAPRTPCEELPRVFLSDRLNITFSGLGRWTGAPQHRPNPPLTAHKTHTPVRSFQNRGDTTPEGPAPRAASGDPETVWACLCPALHEPERRGAAGRRVARDAGLRARERGPGAPDCGRPVPGFRGPRPDRGRRTRLAARRVARPPPPRRQRLRGHRRRPGRVPRSRRLRSGQGGRLASPLDPSVARVTLPRH